MESQFSWELNILAPEIYKKILNYGEGGNADKHFEIYELFNQ